MPAPFLALVGDNETFDPVTHARKDLAPQYMRLDHDESELAYLSIDVKNPATQLSALDGQRVLLSTGGKLFFDGVIQGVPRGTIGSLITVEVIGTTPNPDTLQAQIDTLAESLKQAPYYDALCVPQGREDDWAEILAARSQVLAHSRIQGEPVMCDALGGATTLEVKPLAGSVQYDASQRVSGSYAVSITARWKQLLTQSFNDEGIFFGFSTFTPDAILAAFPKEGAKIGDGFTVTYSVAQEEKDGFGRARYEIFDLNKVPDENELDPAWLEDGVQRIRFIKAPLDLSLYVEYRYEIERTETATVSINTDIQSAVIGNSTETEEINLRDLTQKDTRSLYREGAEYSVGQEVIEGQYAYRCRIDHIAGPTLTAEKWINIGETEYLKSRRVSSFMKTTRGKELAEHLVERIKARARMASRCVYVSFEAAMPRNIHDITHDCMCSITHPNLPGGFATGRLVSYSLEWSQGRWSFRGTIACAAGGGGSDSVVIGDPTGSVQTSLGRMFIDIENDGAVQEQALEDAQTTGPGGEPVIDDIEIPETVISIKTIPAPNTVLEQNINIPISGSVGIEKQVDL